jgi:hypothetical protein
MKHVPIDTRKSIVSLACVFALLSSGTAVADGFVVSKIYDPYVQPLETEIEWRFVSQHDDDLPNLQLHSFGFGRSLSDRWAMEVYGIAAKGPGESFSINSYELEAKWQLTEQGEYALDWGLMFELERNTTSNAWELATQLLAVRDIGKTTITANVGVIYEWGETIQNELETTLRLQARYRWKESFEPSLEAHIGQDTTAIGPAVGGLVRIAAGKKLRWELGVFAGVSERSPDQILKANIEFEF